MAERERRFHFTEKELEKLAPCGEGRQTYYVDTKESGLVFCVTRNGKKSYGYRRKYQGVSRRIFLGKFPDMKLVEARALAAEYNGKVANKINVFEQCRETQKELTVCELFSIYMERHGSKKRTYDDMQKMFDRSCKAIHSKKLSSVSRLVAENLYDELTKRSGPYTANRVMQLMRAVFNKATLWGIYVGNNPFVNVMTFKEVPRERFLEEGEVGTLLNSLECAKVDLIDFVYLSLYTGARKRNVLAMEFSEIDWTNQRWTIPLHKFKGNRPHTIGLGSTEMSILTRRRSEALAMQRKSGVISPFVFPGNGKKGHRMDFKRSWTTLRKRAELEDITIHDLRRSLGAEMANQNVNVALVKNVLGHSDIKTTIAHYAHTNRRAELDAKQLVHAKWESAARAANEKTGNVVTIGGGAETKENA